MSKGDFRATEREWTANLWSRIKSLFTGLDTRVTALEQGGGGGGGGGEMNVINSISLNGTNVPPDANKNVALVEADPTVPAWAKGATKPAYTAYEVGAVPVNPRISCDILEPDNGLPSGMSQLAYTIQFNDINQRPVGKIIVGANNDGSTEVDFQACNFRDAFVYSQGIQIKHNKDGTMAYTVTGPAQFRSAIDALGPTDVIAIEQGGTGDTSARRALEKLGAAYLLTTNTWDDIYTRLARMRTYSTAVIYMSTEVAGRLSNSKVSGVVYGTVSQSAAGTYRFNVAGDSGHYQYSWRVTGFTSAAAPTFGTVYQFTGDAL